MYHELRKRDTSPVSPAEAAALFADLASCDVLVLAVSGGPDSTALALLAARWRAELKHGPRLVAVTIDHGLRPESASEAKAVKRLAKALGIEHRVVAWRGKKPTTGVQTAARSARYGLLAAEARKLGARHVLTAHTRDDQAETILIRLSRGSGLAGLAGMSRLSPLSGNREITLVRPFLGLPKARLVATLKVAEVPFARDPSNDDPRFTRARYRKVMPLLAAEGLDAGRLALLARRAARADAAIETAVAAALPVVSLRQWSNSGPIMLDRAKFSSLPGEVGLRLLGRALAAVGDEGPVELGKLETLFAAIAAQGEDAACGRLRRTLAGALVTVDRDRLVVHRAPARRQKRQD
ncbi:MAG: tRNA lysidine(34) synthetase TilS [Xanthobacteraceae bacterium]|jgi:tRNA(Ile)-lysidine synthase